MRSTKKTPNADTTTVRQKHEARSNAKRRQFVKDQVEAICREFASWRTHDDILGPGFHEDYDPTLSDIEVNGEGKLVLSFTLAIKSDVDAAEFFKSRGLDCTAEELAFLKQRS
jgi:hypothetical protein